MSCHSLRSLAVLGGLGGGARRGGWGKYGLPKNCVFELCVRQGTQNSDWLKYWRWLISAMCWHLTTNSQIMKMASIDVNEQVLSEWIKKALNYLSTGSRDIVLKSEKRVAIYIYWVIEMYSQFCQPMIFTVYTLAKKDMMGLSGINDCCSILVVSPLKSIINDQIADVESLG